jgi:hypothetical protein
MNFHYELLSILKVKMYANFQCFPEHDRSKTIKINGNFHICPVLSLHTFYVLFSKP